MKFVEFIENRYQELTLITQVKKTYDVKSDSEIKALHQILNIYRTLLKWLLIPRCLGHYIAVCFRIKKQPLPALINKLKEEKQVKKVADEMLNNVSSINSDPK